MSRYIPNRNVRTYSLKDTYHTRMFAATLFVIGRTWKLPKGPLVVEWIEQSLVYSHTGVLHSDANKYHTTTGSSADGPHRHTAEWKQLHREEDVIPRTGKNRSRSERLGQRFPRWRVRSGHRGLMGAGCVPSLSGF